MKPVVGETYKCRINGRMARVQIRSRLEVTAHVCGDLWTRPRAWWLALNTESGRTVTIKRASRLRPIRERTAV